MDSSELVEQCYKSLCLFGDFVTFWLVFCFCLGFW